MKQVIVVLTGHPNPQIVLSTSRAIKVSFKINCLFVMQENMNLYAHIHTTWSHTNASTNYVSTYVHMYYTTQKVVTYTLSLYLWN